MNFKFLLAILFLVLSSAGFAGWYQYHEGNPGHDNGNHYGWYKDNGNRHHYSPAPGPIAGAGLPFLAIGYGVYWLVKRRRRKPD